MPKLLLNVFYDDRQTSPIAVASPSATKPKKLVERWIAQSRPIQIHSFEPLKPQDFYLAHDPNHVDAILAAKAPDGFSCRDLRVSATFPWTSGSMFAATKFALENKTSSCSPTSGFHHAGYDSAGGYCTFNGLMITAIKLLNEGLAKKPGIIDCDCHYGDGTDEIITKMGLQKKIKHYTFGAEDDHFPYWKGDERADDWLTRLPIIVQCFSDCDVVLYQAGADPHVNDPLGCSLTTEQMRKRDKIVFTELKTMGIPVAWNLAGGYQHPIEKVLSLHDATLEECLAAM